MSTKTVAFFGASTGIGLSALKNTLAAGHQCIALCRTPSKLTAILPSSSFPNLRVIGGNAHDISAVSQCLKSDDHKLVDEVVSSIGPRLNTSTMTLDDPEVCGKAMKTLLEALAHLRSGGATGNPHIIVVGTTGMSRFGRDTPLIIVPFYKVLLKVPHKDKGVMEDRLVESSEKFTIVRATWLVNGERNKEVRAGIEDPKKGRESEAIGYNISREDAGKWIANNLVIREDPKYLNKIATITY